MRVFRAILVLLWVSTPAIAHDWYTGAVSPVEERSCCTGVDCAPRPARVSPTGTIEILIGGRWWPAFNDRWYLGSSPDGSWHGCMMSYDAEPRCVWGGAGT